jgi:hypothetical protein
MHRLCGPSIFPETSWLQGHLAIARAIPLTTDEFTRAGSVCKRQQSRTSELYVWESMPEARTGMFMHDKCLGFDGANMTRCIHLPATDKQLDAQDGLRLYGLLRLFCLFS